MTRAAEVPDRISWAVDQLDLAPTDRVLEFGCGPGVAASLVADRVTAGSVLAIDRSSTAIARSAARNAGHVDSGRLVLEQTALADLRTDRPFDVAFGVNVNLFWTGAAEAECRVLADVLAPGGVVHIVYETPGDRSRDVPGRVATNLARHGFETTATRGPGARLLRITGCRPPR